MFLIQGKWILLGLVKNIILESKTPITIHCLFSECKKKIVAPSQGSCLKILFDNFIILMSSKYILARNSKSLKWQLTNQIEVSYHPKMVQVWCWQLSDKP